MTQHITAAFPDELAAWIRSKTSGEGDGSYTSRSALVVEAVRYLRAASTTPPSVELTLGMRPTNPEMDAMREAVEEVVSVMGLPIVTPGKSSRKIDAAIDTKDVRMLDILREESDIPHKTTADLVRAFVRIGLQAIDNLRKIDHPAWRAMGLAARARAEHETRQFTEAALEERCHDLWQDLCSAVARGDDQEALSQYSDFYRFAESLPLRLHDEAMAVLADLPIAQEVAWRYPGLVPDPELVPSEAPNPMYLRDKTNLYRREP